MSTAATPARSVRPDPIAASGPDARASERVELSFPDLPRLELDQLLGQLIDRANEVMATQGRLRGLLRAIQLIIGDLDLPTVLRRIAEAARDLVGARYAAIGVIASDGHLAQFVHTGMPDDTVDRIGHLPQGKGLLGALIDDPHPIRLRCIVDDVRSTGFPPGHPPMASFVGVPIRIRDEIFGNLYLAESTKDEFTADDEELAKALAASAAAAIENARLYQAAQQRQDWLRAIAAITRCNSSSTPPGMIADADLVTVIRPADNPDDPNDPDDEPPAARRGRRRPAGRPGPGRTASAGPGRPAPRLQRPQRPSQRAPRPSRPRIVAEASSTSYISSEQDSHGAERPVRPVRARRRPALGQLLAVAGARR